MELRSISLKNFRAHSDCRIEFEPGVSLVCGSNGVGKTTVLEAIHVLMMGKSFRTHLLGDLVGKQGPGFYIEVMFNKHGVEQKLTTLYDGSERKAEHNDTPLRRLTEMLGIIQGVTITPDDVALVKGGPDLRRRYLDFQLSQVDPLYLEHLSRYGKAMRQRNTLLKANDLATIDGWEEEMAHAAAYIVKHRYLAVAELRGLVSRLYAIFSGDNRELRVTYESATGEEGIRDYYLEQYRTERHKELETGTTLSGPHRDDLIITLDEMGARHFASEGQQRMAVAALKFAEWERMRGQTEIKPLMLIDDVGVSLDPTRRERLFSHINDLGQVILTSTDSQSGNAHSIYLH